MAATPPNPELADLPDLFLLNPENRAFIEGKSQVIKRPSSEFNWLFPAILFSVIGLFGIAVSREEFLKIRQ